MSMVKARVWIAVAALSVTCAVAASGEKKNDVGVLVGYIAPTSDSTISGVKTEADSTIDYGLEYKHRFLESNRLSLGVTLLYAQFDVKEGGQKTGTIDNFPILVDVNWHLLKNKNLYVGATAGYAMWGDFKPEGGGSNTSIKQNVVYGLNLGYDIPIGDRWAILTNVRYLAQEAESDEPGAAADDSIDVNPVVVNVGFAFRF